MMLKLVFATCAALCAGQLPEEFPDSLVNKSANETNHEHEAHEQAEEMAREQKKHEEERAREKKERAEERAREAQEHKEEQEREMRQRELERQEHERKHEHQHQEHANNATRCCYEANCKSCEHPQDWCNTDAATCQDCGGKQLCTEEQIAEQGSGPSAGPSAWDEQEHQQGQDQGKQEHEQEHQERTDNAVSCCYQANCQSCEHPQDWCSKDAATCQDCGGKQLCTEEQIAEQESGPSAGPSAWDKQEHQEEQDQGKQEHEQKHQEHEREHAHEAQERADKDMRCCYQANCQSCEHPRDWCNKDAATCEDCGGKQLCTEEQIAEQGSVPSAGPSATEVLAEVKSIPKAPVAIGAFAGMAFLAGVLGRGRHVPSGANVPLLDEEAAAEPL